MANISRCGYYKWLKLADEPDKDYEYYLKIKEIFVQGKGKYGWRNIKMRLEAMNHKKIKRIMRKYGLITKVRKKNPYKQMMKKNLEHRTFPNKLQREFHQIIPFKVFCTDITYIPFQNRFAYLSVIKDIATGEIVAWNLSLSLEIVLVTDTVRKMRLESYEDIMIHSDQGFHYTSPAYIEILKELKMVQSMSGKGKCIDNAPVESFFGHLKDELDCKSCKSFEDIRSKIAEYMQYYNNERKQWTKNKMTPVEYRNHLLSQKEGAWVVGF